MLNHAYAAGPGDPPLVRAVLGMLAGLRLALTLPSLRPSLAELIPEVYVPLVRRALGVTETWAGVHPDRHADVLRASLYFSACADCVMFASEYADTDWGAADAAAAELARELVELEAEAPAFRAAARRLPPPGLLN